MAKVTTPYVFLYRTADTPTWTELTTKDGAPLIQESRGAEQAVRDLLKYEERLAQLARDVGVEVWPVPNRSRTILPVRLVPQDPIIKIG